MAGKGLCAGSQLYSFEELDRLCYISIYTAGCCVLACLLLDGAQYRLNKVGWIGHGGLWRVERVSFNL